MSEASPPLTRVPAAHPWPRNVVKHPAWRAAWSMMLSTADAGSTTMALIGEAGTGKTWLLQGLGHELRERGCQVTLLRQGDLPFDLKPGTVLLVDEASRMDAGTLADLAVQRRALVILADLPAFTQALEALSLPLCVIRLQSLDPRQIRSFVADWMQQHNEWSITDDAVERLGAHSNGTPRLITQLLNAALAFAAASDKRRIGSADIDQAAELRLGGLECVKPQAVQTDAASAPAPVVRQRRATRVRKRRTAALALSALAACFMIGWFAAPRHRVALETAVVPAPSLAGTPRVALADAVAGLAPEPSAPPSALVAPASPATAAPVFPAAPAPLVLGLTQPLAPSPGAELPSHDEVRAEPGGQPGRGGAGLILIARRGDTLQRLYANIYQGLRPPAYDDVAAANPHPFRPGGMVVFPEPPEGWARP